MKHFLIALLLSFGPPAAAGGMFRTSGMYMSSSIAGLEGSRTLVDVNPGYIRDKGWFFAGTYQMDVVKSGSTGLTTASLGPTIGRFTRREFGFYGVATYFAKASRDDGREGSGYQADLGYRFSFHHFSYALQFSYKHFTFRNDARQSLEVSRVDPYFGVWYEY